MYLLHLFHAFDCRTAGLELPPPGTVVQRDYRTAVTRLAAASEWGKSALPAAATGGGGQVRDTVREAVRETQ
jgi:hypothetical protein